MFSDTMKLFSTFKTYLKTLCTWPGPRSVLGKSHDLMTHLVNKYVTCTHNAQTRFRSVRSVHLCLRISVPTLFHASVPSKVFPFQLCFRLLFHAAVPRYFHSSSVPCICSSLPFYAAVPNKYFRSRSVRCICSRLLFVAAVPDKSSSVPPLFHASVPDFRSMQLFQTKKSVPALFHASVPDFRSMQLFQTKFFAPALFHAYVPDSCTMQLFQTKYFHSSSVPCICSRLPFHAAVPDKSISVPARLHASVPDFHSMQLFHTKYSICIIGTHFGSR